MTDPRLAASHDDHSPKTISTLSELINAMRRRSKPASMGWASYSDGCWKGSYSRILEDGSIVSGHGEGISPAEAENDAVTNERTIPSKASLDKAAEASV